MLRVFCLTLAVGACACILLVPLGVTAGADATYDITLAVHNSTDKEARIAPVGQVHCWHNGGLENAITVPPSSGALVTTGVQTVGLVGECAFPNEAWRWIELQTKNSSGAWINPAAAAQGNAEPITNSNHLELHGDYANLPRTRWKMVLRGVMERWLPRNPLQNGKQGPGGLICIGKNYQASGRQLNISLSNQASVCAAQPDTYTLGEIGARRAKTGTMAAPRLPSGATAPKIRLGPGGNGAIVIDLLSVARTLCDWVRPAPRWGDRLCSDITNVPGKWDLNQLSEHIKNVTPENTLTPILSLGLAAPPQEARNATGTAGKLTFDKAVKHGTVHTVETENGWKRGFEIEGGVKIAKVVEFGATGKFEWDHSDTESQETSTEVSEKQGYEQETAPHKVTYLYVFQHQADLTFNFSANIVSGNANEAHPIKTPLARALGMSPARVHPCIGYLTGPGDPNSLLEHVKRLVAQGNSEANPNIPPDRRTLLRALPGFRQLEGDTCPGWPNGFPAALAFRGKAAVQIHAGGPTSTAEWAGNDVKTALIYCAFTTPLGAPAPEEKQVRDSSCLGGRSKGGKGDGAAGAQAPQTKPGLAFRGDGSVSGGPGSDLLLAKGGGKNDVLTAGGGKLDVLQGAAGRQIMNGGRGQDFATGGPGNDAIVGGPGPDTLLGGAGGDQLRDGSGMNRLAGGAGNDGLWTSRPARGGLLGGAGDDVLTMRGNADAALVGGPGKDLYLFKGAKNDVSHAVEFAGQGVDAIRASHSFVLPPYIEIGRAWRTRKGISIRAGDGSQKLVGGPGDDRLDGGVGGDILTGGRGRDTLLIGDYGADVVTGGAGADRFVPVAHPVGPPATAQDFQPERPTANLIKDFSPAAGDRLVLKAASYGPEVLALRSRMIVRDGANPQPAGTDPQLLFAGQGSLLRFDPDGDGPMVAYAIAILRGFEHLPTDAIDVQTRH